MNIQRFFRLAAGRLGLAAAGLGMLPTQLAAADLPSLPKPLDLDALNRKVDPCDDFYEFACGGWIAKTTIPPDRSGWSRGFFDIAKRNEEILRTAFEQAAANTAATGEERQIGSYYAACMDEQAAEASSLLQLQRRLRAFTAVTNAHTLAMQVARAHLEGINVLFGFGNEQDAKDSSLMIAGVDQGGLGLPDRDYYLSQEKKPKEIRARYQKHIEAMMTMVGEPAATAKKTAATVMRLETTLAKGALDRVSRRDPEKVYHRLERAGLAKLTPSFDWSTYFETVGTPSVQAMNISVPDFFKQLDTLLRQTSLADLRTYMRWRTVSRAAPMLAKKFVDENFHFTSQAFTGALELEPRWKRCVSATTHALLHPTDKAFVAATFKGASKDMAKDMIKEVEAAFGDELQQLSWMDEPTRAEAKQKLATLVNQVGYPDKWRSYQGLAVSRDSYLVNSLTSSIFESRYGLAKIGKPVDRLEWYMPASMVNAYYSAENNDMVFPAGILQPPFFAVQAPLPVNYGGIGMVMGHELTHGFDDQGRKFDAKGNLRDWWTQTVADEFNKGTSCLDQQYSGYVAIDDMHVNGRLTMGENIADQGGIRLAYNAWLKKTGGQGETREGFTPAQQLFLGYAQSWCIKLRPERARVLATIDPHAPAHFRVNGPLTNYEEFAKAFSCQEKKPMAPTQRCKIW